VQHKQILKLRDRKASRAVRVDVHGGDSASVIRTSRLILRALTEDDHDPYTSLLARAKSEVGRYFPLHAEGETDTDVFHRHRQLAEVGDQTGRALRRVALDDEGRMIGAFSLLSISRGLEWKADITAWLAPDMWGQGYATEAVTGIIDHAFQDLPGGLGLHHLNAWIIVENQHSKYLFDRLGFKKASEERSFLSVNDMWHMHELWTLNVTDWPGAQQPEAQA